MLIGKVVRPPATGATLASVDDASARRVRGVTVVRDGSFIGVTAAKPCDREQAATARSPADWNVPLPGQPSSATIFEYLKAHAQAPAPRPAGITIRRSRARRTR